MSDEQKPARKRGRPRKQASTWEDRLVLNAGETLRKLPRITKGNLGQYETERHELINAQGQVVGDVEYHVSTSLQPPFRRSYSLVQRGSDGKVIVEARW
jgi:hypothetical protein